MDWPVIVTTAGEILSNKSAIGWSHVCNVAAQAPPRGNGATKSTTSISFRKCTLAGQKARRVVVMITQFQSLRVPEFNITSLSIKMPNAF
jgi:hypothetical protein